MLDLITLKELKSRMPRGYTNKVLEKYEELYNKQISSKTLFRFFKGDSYSTEVHNSVLVIAEEQEVMNVRTNKVLGNATT